MVTTTQALSFFLFAFFPAALASTIWRNTTGFAPAPSMPEKSAAWWFWSVYAGLWSLKFVNDIHIIWNHASLGVVTNMELAWLLGVMMIAPISAFFLGQIAKVPSVKEFFHKWHLVSDGAWDPWHDWSRVPTKPNTTVFFTDGDDEYRGQVESYGVTKRELLVRHVRKRDESSKKYELRTEVSGALVYADSGKVIFFYRAEDASDYPGAGREEGNAGLVMWLRSKLRKNPKLDEEE